MCSIDYIIPIPNYYLLVWPKLGPVLIPYSLFSKISHEKRGFGCERWITLFPGVFDNYLSPVISD